MDYSNETRDWLAWVSKAERSLGYRVDVDEAHDAYQRGRTAEQYVETVRRHQWMVANFVASGLGEI